MADVFPARNLPGGSEAWGRSVETIIQEDEGDLLRVDQSLENTARGVSGDLAVMSRQINELFNRSEEVLNLPDISDSSNQSEEPFVRKQTTATFSPTSGNRPALLTLYCTVTDSDTSASRGNNQIALIVSYKGATVLASLLRPSRPTSTPSEWQNSLSYTLTSAVSLKGEDAPVFDITYFRVGGWYFPPPNFTETPNPTSTVSLTNVSLSLSKQGVIL